jgi:hypothetical protein
MGNDFVVRVKVADPFREKIQVRPNFVCWREFSGWRLLSISLTFQNFNRRGWLRAHSGPPHGPDHIHQADHVAGQRQRRPRHELRLRHRPHLRQRGAAPGDAAQREREDPGRVAGAHDRGQQRQRLHQERLLRPLLARRHQGHPRRRRRPLQLRQPARPPLRPAPREQ